MSDSNSEQAKRILVVDDNVDTRSFIVEALERADYEVRSASEGAQALALLQQRPADLLITDIFMPGQEGIETIARCKAQFPQTKIIAMSAGSRVGRAAANKVYKEQDYLSTAALLGVDANLRKPFKVEQLLDTVHRVLQPR